MRKVSGLTCQRPDGKWVYIVQIEYNDGRVEDYECLKVYETQEELIADKDELEGLAKVYFIQPNEQFIQPDNK